MTHACKKYVKQHVYFGIYFQESGHFDAYMFKVNNRNTTASKVWNMFKVNNKDTRTYFTPCSSVSIVNFEHLNAGLNESNWFTSTPYKNHEK